MAYTSTLADHRIVHSLSTGTSVAISGSWQPSPPLKEQSYELKAKEVRIVGSTEPDVSVSSYCTGDVKYFFEGSTIRLMT